MSKALRRLRHAVFGGTYLLGAVVTVSGIFVFLQWPVVSTEISDAISMPVVHKMQHALDLDPAVTTRLKILAFDDRSVELLGQREPSLSQLASIVNDLARAQPSTILIDRIFGLTEKDDETFLESLDSYRRVFAGGYSAGTVIPGRPRLENPCQVRGTCRDMTVGPGHNLIDSDIRTLRETSPPGDRGARYLYGPSPRYLRAIAGVGHVEYANPLLVPPVIFGMPAGSPAQPEQVSREQALPALGLFAADYVGMTQDPRVIQINGVAVRLDPLGRLRLHLFTPGQLMGQAKSIGWYLQELEAGRSPASEWVRSQDVVMILPSFYTGGTDFKDSPLGSIPGGSVHAAMVHSVLTGRWIQISEWPWLYLMTAVVLGLGMGLGTGGLTFVLFSVLLVVGWSGVGIVAMIWRGWEIPWVESAVMSSLVSLLVFSRRQQIAEARHRKLQASLKGLVPDATLEGLQRLGESQSLPPVQTVCTVVFIDIAGFSLAAEHRSPEEVFSGLKSMIDLMARMIHANGGVIEKTLGDGLLAIFGVSYDGSRPDPDHATAATRCAIAIHREVLALNEVARIQRSPIYPVRIGINTASVVMGDLGNSMRIDITVIGEGVNLAKRLEQSCEIYRILLGPSTRALLGQMEGEETVLRKRLIPIKHHDEAFEAYEIDPFANDVERMASAVRAYHESHGLQRESERTILSGGRVRIRTVYGDGSVINMGVGGLGVLLPKYLGRDMELVIELLNEDGQPDPAFDGLSPTLARVVWARPHGRQYLHGLSLKGLGKLQQERVRTLLLHSVAA